MPRKCVEDLLHELNVRSAPEDYIRFVATYGSCAPAREIQMGLPSPLAEYVHPEGVDLPVPRHSAVSLAHFYGVGQATTTLRLDWATRTYQDRLPEGFVPIADDGAGNQICWGPSLDGKPSFHWWDHENEWDAGDYEEDTGSDMPDDAKYQNVYFLASSLEEMFSLMRAMDGPSFS